MIMAYLNLALATDQMFVVFWPIMKIVKTTDNNDQEAFGQLSEDLSKEINIDILSRSDSSDSVGSDMESCY